jgi:hypothetical protein
VLEAPERGALNRRRFGIERVDFDTQPNRFGSLVPRSALNLGWVVCQRKPELEGEMPYRSSSGVLLARVFWKDPWKFSSQLRKVPQGVKPMAQLFTVPNTILPVVSGRF